MQIPTPVFITPCESLASIDFNDFEPSMDTPEGETIATCAYFRTDRKSPQAGDTIANQDPEKFSILSVAEGSLESAAGRRFAKGQFLLLPCGGASLKAIYDSAVLQVTLP